MSAACEPLSALRTRRADERHRRLLRLASDMPFNPGFWLGEVHTIALVWAFGTVPAHRMHEAAEAEYARTKALFDENVTSQQQLDTKQRNYEVTTTNVARARKALEKKAAEQDEAAD